jgi:hypothetical protein
MISFVSSEVVWVPVGEYVNKKGEVKTKFCKVGVRVQISDGTSWFYSFIHDTWTKHLPAYPVKNRAGLPVYEHGKATMQTPPAEHVGNEKKLRQSYGHCAALIAALQFGVMSAA